MPPRRYPPRLVSRIALGAALLLALQATPTLLAADVTWSATGSSTAGGDGNWTGGSTWWNGSSAVSWTDGDNAFFTAAGNTTVNSSVAVNQIAFTNSADNISILGGAGDITLASGITARNTANTAALTFTISESIALGASQTWGVTNGGTTGTANLVVSGNISGTGYGITKDGNGMLTISGTNNTYTGTTTINAGTLNLANTAANNKAIVGDIAISGGTLNLSNVANQIADTSSVTMTSGTLNLFQNETINSLSVSGGTVALRTANVSSSAFSFTGGKITVGVRATIFTLNGPITLGNFNFEWTAASALYDGIIIGGDIAVNTNTTANFTGTGGRLTLNTNRAIDVGTGANMNVQWGIVGAGGFTKNGTGTLTLSNANTYSGATTVSAGVLNLARAGGGAAASTASVSVASGANLLISQSDQVNNSAAVTLSGGTITRASGVSEVFGNLNLTQASLLDFGSGTAGNLTFGTYTPSSLLTVQNFFGGNTLVFGSDLTTSINNGSLFSFDNGFTSSWDAGSSTFTITAIPEASTYLAAAGLAGLLLWPLRRRIFKRGECADAN